ncbi:MAG: DUF1254 domain-containing protein [Pirellula sp.]|jgi:hypothetical protein|nr:DUF1254 domain-containing protein [Pirellula sp.]
MRAATVLFVIVFELLSSTYSSRSVAEFLPAEHTPTEPSTAIASTFPEHEIALLAKAYQWGWPLVYLHNVKNSMGLISNPGVSGGAPVAPVNRLSMLTEPLDPRFKSVPCPNRDVIYGFALLDLEKDEVVLQVPDAKSHVWMFQLGDHRTDSFGELGSVYASKPGLYLVVGPDWNGQKPDGFVDVFRSPTNLAYIIPRYFVYQHNLDEVQSLIKEVAVYPWDNFTGRWKIQNWERKKWYPAIGESTRERCKQVNPASYFESLREVLNQVPPLKGEEAFYGDMKLALEQVFNDEEKCALLSLLAEQFERELITPHFDFRNVGSRLPHGWTTVHNAANFGTDYISRMAVAKSNIFVNRPREAKYFYLEVDQYGQRLNGSSKYEIVLRSDQLPQNRGFWSLTVYDEDHRLIEQDRHCSSFAISAPDTRSSNIQPLRIVLCNDKIEGEQIQWLPTPKGNFTLYLRVYAPSESVLLGQWSPPGVSPIPSPFIAAN